MQDDLRFEMIPAGPAVAQWRDDWEALLGPLALTVPFQSPAWIEAYCRQWQDDGAALQLVIARRGPALAAVLPVHLQRRRLGPMSVRMASLLVNPHMPLGDITARPEDAALWPALQDWLLGPTGPRCARLELSGIAADATLGRWLATHTARQQMSAPQSEAARIDTRGDFDSLIKGVSSKHRSNLSRSTKRAEAIGPLRYEVFDGAAVLAQGWPLLLEIEASGWKGRAGTAIGTDAMLQRFYRDAIEGLAAQGRARIGVLWLGDQAAAAGLLLMAGRTVYVHKLGYREDWSAMGPGHLLMRDVLQRACDDPVVDQVSLVLHPPWSDVWRPVLSPVMHHQLYATTWQGRCLWALAEFRRRRAAARVQPQHGVAVPAAEVAGD